MTLSPHILLVLIFFDMRNTRKTHTRNTHPYMNSLPEMSKKRDDYAVDLGQFRDLVRQMDEHKDALAKKVEERTQELDETNRQSQELADQIDALAAKVESQELNVEDVVKMQHEKARLKEVLEKTRALKELNKDTVWKLQTELNEVYEELDSAVHEYNTLVTELSLQRRAEMETAATKVTIHKEVVLTGSEKDFLGADLCGEVQSLLRTIKDSATTDAANAKDEHQQNTDAVESGETQINEVTNELEVRTLQSINFIFRSNMQCVRWNTIVSQYRCHAFLFVPIKSDPILSTDCTRQDKEASRHPGDGERTE